LRKDPTSNIGATGLEVRKVSVSLRLFVEVVQAPAAMIWN